MRILPWRPRTDPKVGDAVSKLLWLARGAYSGRARYLPRHLEHVPPSMRAAVGEIVNVQFVGNADVDGPFGGQALFRENPGTDLLQGCVIAEQDLDFLG